MSTVRRGPSSELGNAEGPRQGLERGSTPLRARWSRGLTRHKGPAKSNSNCDLTTNDRGGDRLRSPAGSARSLARNGMPAFVQAPVLPEATPCRLALRPLRAQGGAFGARASLLDAGWMRDALSSDTVTRRVPSIESRGPASSHASNLSNGLTTRRYRLTTIWAISGIEAVPSQLFARSVRSGRAGIKPSSGRLQINSCGNHACLKPSCAFRTLHPCWGRQPAGRCAC